MSDITEKVAELRRLASDASPGPWRADGEGLRAMLRDESLRIIATRHRATAKQNEADMRYYAAANPAAVLSLCDEIDRQRAALAAAGAALKAAMEREARHIDLLQKASFELSEIYEFTRLEQIPLRKQELASIGRLVKRLDAAITEKGNARGA